MTLAELLDTIEADLPDVRRDTASGGTTWLRGDRPFAIVAPDGRSAEFLLDPKVAAAAARTPETALSARGSGWVRFQPSVLDDHGVDRATAWFHSAYRGSADRGRRGDRL